MNNLLKSIESQFQKYPNAIPLLLIFFFNLLIYGSLIKNGIVLNWDDFQIVKPMQALISLSEYSNSLTPDLQPIRDISIWVDTRLENIFPFSVYHTTNFTIWFLFLVIINNIINSIEALNKFNSKLLLILFSIHPVFINSVGWISARKHLLSALFISIAIMLVLNFNKYKKIKFTIPIWYLLSSLSNPINSLFPIWFGIYSYRNKLNKSLSLRVILGLCLLLMLTVMFYNYTYYNSEIYFQQANFVKILPFWENIHLIPLMYGRYFINLILPMNLSTVYALYSPYNIIGILLFISFGLFIKNKISKKALIEYGTLFFYPLILVTFQITAIFVFDTYLLIPALGLLFLLAVYFKTKFEIRELKIYFLVFTIFFIKSVTYSNTWLNDQNLWENTYYTQGDSSSVRTYIDSLLSKRAKHLEHKKVFQLINELSQFTYNEVKKDVFDRLEFLFKRINEDKNYSNNEKISALQDLQVNSYSRFYYLGELSEKNNNMTDACNNYQKSKKYFSKRKTSYVSQEQLNQKNNNCCSLYPNRFCQ